MIIVLIVTISVTLHFVQEGRAQNAVEALRDSAAVQAIVLRDRVRFFAIGTWDVADLVAGDLVPADS